MAFSRPCPYVLDSEAKGANAAAIAVLVINDLLELDIVLILFSKKIELDEMIGHYVTQKFWY
jgi:hypothetical protein